MKPFHGILSDARGRYRSYVSDYTDAWHRKVISSSDAGEFRNTGTETGLFVADPVGQIQGNGRPRDEGYSIVYEGSPTVVQIYLYQNQFGLSWSTHD